jgi:hypothetical protein
MGPLEEFLDLVEDGHHDGTLCFAGLRAFCARPAEREIYGWGGSGEGPDDLPWQWSIDGIVDENIAVVSATVNGIPVVWQRPVSGVFAMPLGTGEDIGLVLYTADGLEVPLHP